MGVTDVVVKRIYDLCKERNITPNALSYLSGVSQSTVKSILNGESKNPGVVTIKKLCDGLDMSIVEFFDTEDFKKLEQEIKKPLRLLRSGFLYAIFLFNLFYSAYCSYSFLVYFFISYYLNIVSGVFLELLFTELFNLNRSFLCSCGFLISAL